jgi:ribosomal protein S12 methylthiotransferase
MEQLEEEARALAAKGTKELLIIAQDATYYGLDLYKERRLAELMVRLSKVEGIEWIKLHYAFPTGFPMDVLDVMRDTPNICNYIDIPLQHAADNVLKSMRRGTTLAKTEELIASIRECVPGIAIRTTLISGYPGETEEDHQTLVDFVRRNRFDRLGVFTYSHEENTHAYGLVDDVPAETKQDRVDEIMAVQQRISSDINQQKIGQEFKVLIDRKEGNYYVGRTEFDSPEVDNEVLIEAKDLYLRQGNFVQVRITDAGEFDLFGIPV